MRAYAEFRESKAYQEVHPDGSDGRVYWYCIEGTPERATVWLMVGDEVRFAETLCGPSAQVRSIHIGTAWLQFAAQAGEPPEVELPRWHGKGRGGPGAKPPANRR